MEETSATCSVALRMLPSGVPSYRRTTNVATTHGPSSTDVGVRVGVSSKAWTHADSASRRVDLKPVKAATATLPRAAAKKRRRVGDLLEQICRRRVGFSPVVRAMETDLALPDLATWVRALPPSSVKCSKDHSRN